MKIERMSSRLSGLRFYRVWPRSERQVRQPNHFHESVHPSVLERMHCPKSSYAPKNRHLEQVFAEIAESAEDYSKAA